MTTKNKAALVINTPVGVITSTDVQGAINELAGLIGAGSSITLDNTGELPANSVWVVDTTAARNRDLTLGPTAGVEMIVVAVGDVATNNVTLGRNGETINGVAADFVLTEPTTLVLKYDAVNSDWVIVSHAFPRTGGTVSGAVTLASTLGVTGVTTLSDNLTVDEVTETVHVMTGTLVDAANGTWQTRTLAGNEDFTFSLAAGQSVFVTVVPGANTLSFTNVTEWVGGAAPATVEAEHGFVFWSDDGIAVSGQSVGGIS